jgi:hypothetical protein
MMNTNNAAFVISGLAIALLLSALPCAAQDHRILVPGDPLPVQGAVYPTISDGVFTDFIPNTKRSFCCTISSNSTAPVRFGTVRLGAVDMTVAERGLSDPYLPIFSGNPNPARARVCFTSPDNSIGVLALQMLVSETGVGGSASNVRVLCEETTLFGGYNLSVTDFNFLELTNTTDQSISGKIRGTNSLTNGAFTYDFTVGGAARRDISIHELVSGGFGPVMITHDGAPGSLRAITSQYRIVSTDPLDFQPVKQDDFKTRAQLR